MRDTDNILLIGQGATTVTALESLAEQFSISAVFRTPIGIDDPVLLLAKQRGIPVITDVSLAKIEHVVHEVDPACVLISSYDRLIPPHLLQLSSFINVHYGPLPRYRGRANVNWAIINGETEAWVTIHCVDATLDSGNILLQQSIPIGPHSTIGELYRDLNEVQRQHLGKTVRRFLNGGNGAPQVGSATYCCTRVPDDGDIDWTASTTDIYALIRALSDPYPGAYTYLRLQKLVIVRAAIVENASHYIGRIPGRVCGIHRDGAVDVLTGDGVLRIFEIRDVSGTTMPARQLVRSLKETLGLTKIELLRRLEDLSDKLGHLAASGMNVEPRPTNLVRKTC
ncbi:MAG TPA: formyltransferase family protein [Bryobacteraceae bacterium]|nr:formyltransferase family protein [Bryobacteraceae bacterium]